MKVPQLRKIKELISCHNVTWEDNYSWIHQKNILEVLKDKKKLNPEVESYLNQENDYTEHHLKNTKNIQKKLFDEIKRRIKLEDESIFESKKGESETLAGFVLEISKSFPKIKTQYKFKNYTFTIEGIDNKRIKQIKVSIKR